MIDNHFQNDLDFFNDGKALDFCETERKKNDKMEPEYSSDTIDNKLNEYGIKDKMVKGVDYAKSAGGYLVDKGKEIANTNIVQGAVNKVKDGVEFVNNSAINLFNNINQIGIDNNNESKNEPQNNNLDFLNEFRWR